MDISFLFQHLPLAVVIIDDILLIVTALSAIGGAVATYQQGRTNAAITERNAQRENTEARQQLSIARMQEALQMRAAESERAYAEAEANAAFLNAQLTKNAATSEVQANEARSREEIRRAREEARQRLAEQGALFAGAGVLGTTGTPLAVLASTAMLEEANVADQQYMVNVERTKTLFEADVEAANLINRGKTISAQAGAQYALDKNSAKVQGLAAQIGARNRMSQADLNRQTGQMLKKQATYSAIGQGISGVASAFSLYSGFTGLGRNPTVPALRGGTYSVGSGRAVTDRPPSLSLR